MIEVQLFLMGLFATAGQLLGDLVTSIGGVAGALGDGIREALAGLRISISK